MSFQALLAAIDHYVTLKKTLRERPAARSSDWDCGLAMEFEDSLAEADANEQLDKAALSLRRALDLYIDERIRAAVGEGHSSHR
jgi:hypothetical protein